MSNHLYQLSNTWHPNLQSGDWVAVNGPFDTFGQIITKQENGTYLIRGRGKVNNSGIETKHLPQF